MRYACDNRRVESRHAPAMHRVRRANELVVGDAEPLPHGREAIGKPVHERLWSDALLCGGLFDLLPVLIHPDEEVDVVATKAMIPGNRIRTDLLVRMTDVGITVGVVDRRGEKKTSQLRSIRDASVPSSVAIARRAAGPISPAATTAPPALNATLRARRGRVDILVSLCRWPRLSPCWQDRRLFGEDLSLALFKLDRPRNRDGLSRRNGQSGRQRITSRRPFTEQIG